MVKNSGKPAAATQTAKTRRSTPSSVKDDSVATKPTLDAAELKQFLSLRHHDPHQILGPHLSNDGLVIRAFRPDAERLEVLIGTRRPVE